nr:hypothetical protein [Lachnospiraceae bacterium]
IVQAKKLWGRLFHGGIGAVYTPITEQFNNLIEMKFLYYIGFGEFITTHPCFFLVLFILLILTACFTMRNTQEKVADMHYNNRETVVIVLLVVWSVMSMSEVSEFLYFNF